MSETNLENEVKIESEIVVKEMMNPSKESNDILDLKVALDAFTSCQKKDDELLLSDYLRGYIELNKFFPILGAVFNFVSSDVQKKVTILQCLVNGGAGDYYFSFQSMLEYEKENDIIHSNPQNGSRTLLRLHRALEFIAGFLEALLKAPNEDKMGSYASEIYQETLAKHHGWFIAKTVCAILYLVPTKQTISQKVTGGSEEALKENESILPQLIDVLKSVHNATQKLFEDYGYLDLP